MNTCYANSTNYEFSIQGLSQIFYQIVWMFKTNRNAQQIVRSFCSYSFDGGAMFDETFHTTQASCSSKQFHLCRNGESFLASSFHLERKHSSKELHLLLSNLIPWTFLESRIMHGLDFGVFTQKCCYLEGIFRVGSHAVG